MPELPEVETIKLFLEKSIVGLKIKSVGVLNPKSFFGNPDLLFGKEIQSVDRRAKVLRIGFGEFELLIHLKMSGQMILVQNNTPNANALLKSKIQKYNSKLKSEERFLGGHPTRDMHLEMPNRSTRVIFSLSDGSILFFNDQRKFGWIKLVDRDQVVVDRFLSRIGPEPLDKNFTWEILKENLLRRKKTPVKVALLDQQIVAGVGNIYACEACFLAGIDPIKKCGELKDQEFKKIHKGVIEALENGVKYGGSSRTHFVNPEGKKGTFLDFAFVYGREGIPCKRCKNPIKKIKLGGRGTFYCEICQK